MAKREGGQKKKKKKKKKKKNRKHGAFVQPVLPDSSHSPQVAATPEHLSSSAAHCG